MKYIVLIGDGMADNPVAALGGKTPLEVADKPTLDRLASAGITGSVKTVPDGVEPGSATAILSIFGYDPRLHYKGRAPLEAAGADVKLSPGETAFRCNLISLSPGKSPYIASHNGGGIDGNDALSLMRDLISSDVLSKLMKKAQMRFALTPTFRQIAITGTDFPLDGLRLAPPHDHLRETAEPLLPSGSPMADLLAEITLAAHVFLDKHIINERRRAAGLLPANGIWFWAEGKACALEPFSKRFELKGFVVSAVPLVQGIGVLAGLDKRLAPGATGDKHTNYMSKAMTAASGLREGYDFALIHVEAPDECTHEGDLNGKIGAIKCFSELIIYTLLNELESEPFRMLILSDHKTLTETRGHDGDPVPFIIYDSRIDTHSGRIYTEQDCSKGEYIHEGHMLIERLLKA